MSYNTKQIQNLIEHMKYDLLGFIDYNVVEESTGELYIDIYYKPTQPLEYIAFSVINTCIQNVSYTDEELEGFAILANEIREEIDKKIIEELLEMCNGKSEEKDSIQFIKHVKDKK